MNKASEIFYLIAILLTLFAIFTIDGTIPILSYSGGLLGLLLAIIARKIDKKYKVYE